MDRWSELEQYCAENAIPCGRDVPLAGLCTFKIGGPAALLIQPTTAAQVAGLYAAARQAGVPLLVLGRGSNILFSDAGFAGAVLQLGSAFAEMRLVDDTAIDCDSGASLTQLCLFAWEHGLSGLEFAYGIPGSVGGAIYMNAGAYGGEIKDVLTAARHIEPDGGSGELRGEEMRLTYRHSAYSDGDRIITGGRFALQRGDKVEIRARMDDYMNRRRTKQPLDFPSAGSTFKRPEGAYASALIDQCGLKGRRVGGAVVSEKHAGFVVNAGGATCADVKELIALVRREVLEKTGFWLECEVKML